MSDVQDALSRPFKGVSVRLFDGALTGRIATKICQYQEWVMVHQAIDYRAKPIGFIRGE